KQQVVPPDLLEEVFDLNMQLDELRLLKKAQQDDPALLAEVGRQKLELEGKSAALQNELQGHWNAWDQVEAGGSDDERRQVRDRMVDLLNRRNYIRNLVKTVEEVLEG